MGTNPAQVGIDWVVKAVGHEPGSKPVCSILPWSLHPFLPLGPSLALLSWLPAMVDCSP